MALVEVLLRGDIAAAPVDARLQLEVAVFVEVAMWMSRVDDLDLRHPRHLGGLDLRRALDVDGQHRGSSPCRRIGTCFRFRMMSVTSSTTPGIDENSCSTPSIWTAVTAAPSMEDSRQRRRALPMVVPKPRSNGWAMNRP
jgi:hypothetical protein